MKLNELIVARVLADFAVLIKETAESEDRTRFGTIELLARQAQEFQRFTGKKVGDFDGIDLNGVSGGGGYLGQIVNGPAIGDQAEMFRTLIDSIKDMSIKRTSPAVELKELFEVKRLLEGKNTDDIDSRIDQLRREIVNGTIAAVVHPELLRGSAPGEGFDDDGVDVGERHSDRAEGARDFVRSRSEEGLGEGHGARPDEGPPASDR